MPPKEYLTAMEYATIVGELMELGIESVRLTGGEPPKGPAGNFSGLGPIKDTKTRSDH